MPSLRFIFGSALVNLSNKLDVRFNLTNENRSLYSITLSHGLCDKVKSYASILSLVGDSTF